MIEMMVIIIGTNRAEMCKVPVKDQDKHFFMTRKQLYKVYPDGLSRMRIYDEDGIEQESDEVLVYAENAVVPYAPRHVSYKPDRILAEIDEHKLMGGSKTIWPYRIYFTQARDIWRQLAPIFPLIVAGVVLLYALL